MIDAMHIKGEMKPRTYRKRAHRDYLALVKNRKSTAKKIRKAIGKQLGYLARNLGHIERMLAAGKALLPRHYQGQGQTPVESGAKLDISVVNGWTCLEVLSFDSYNEATKLTEMIERYKFRTGNYPKRVLADKIYRNRDNLAYCKERRIRLSGPALGRPKREE